MQQQVNIASQLQIKKAIESKNRLFKSAMSESLGDKQHNPKKELIRLYEKWADGGIGISVTGNVMVDRTALGEPGNVVLDSKSDLAAFKKWAEAGTRNNTQLWMQLNHPGKQSPKFLSKKPLAPSAVPLGGGLEKSFATPRELSHDEITEIVQHFATSAKLAKKAGFTGVQIHGAHGYLVSQFLSPHHNRRTDQWGGSHANRMRFVIELYRKIRLVVGPDFPVAIKLNSSDLMKSGFSQEDSILVAQELEKEGIDLIEISGGTYESPAMMTGRVKESTKVREAYFLEFASHLQEHINIPLVVTGGFRSRSAMDRALRSGATDLIGLARPLAVEPDFPSKLLTEKEYSIALQSPTTGFRALDKMTILSVTYYEYLLSRIGSGKKVRPDHSAWNAVLQIFTRMGIYAFAKRRA